MRIIDADSIKYHMTTECGGHGVFLAVDMVYKEEIDAIPTITREQVEKMRGKWIDARYSSKDVPQCQCSICGKKYIGLETDFCQ